MKNWECIGKNGTAGVIGGTRLLLNHRLLMIEAFSEIEKDAKTIDDLKTWLLKK